MRQLILSLICCCFLLTACNNDGANTSSTTSSKKKQVDINKREFAPDRPIKDLDDQVIRAIQAHDMDWFYSISSEQLTASHNDIYRLVKRTSVDFVPEKFVVLDEFHVKDQTPGEVAQVTGAAGKANEYKLSFKAMNTDNYVVCGYFDQPIHQNVLVLIFGNQEGKWELNLIQLGAYAMAGKNAIEILELAKKQTDQAHYMNALNNLMLMNKVARPIPGMWVYSKEDEILQFGKQLIKEAEDKVEPAMVVDQIPSKPEIFNVLPQAAHTGYYPTIQYATRLDINDTLKLAKECDALHAIIGDLYKGLDQETDLLYYKVFPSIPTKNNPVGNHVYSRRND